MARILPFALALCVLSTATVSACSSPAAGADANADAGAEADVEADADAEADVEADADGDADAFADANADADVDTDADTSFDGGDSTNSFSVDFAGMAEDPVGNWVLMPHPVQNSTVSNIPSFETGEPTTVSLTTSGWVTGGFHETNWSAGDIDWLLEIVAEDAYGGGVSVPGTATFSGLDGIYRVEVVAATAFEFGTVRVEVNGSTTTASGRADADSASWDPKVEGTEAGDWLVFPSVAAAGGSITISVQPGLLNAVRLQPVP